MKDSNHVKIVESYGLLPDTTGLEMGEESLHYILGPSKSAVETWMFVEKYVTRG